MQKTRPLLQFLVKYTSLAKLEKISLPFKHPRFTSLLKIDMK